MCGISGIVSPGNFDAEEIILMNSAIRHRGPDDEGFLLLDAQRNLHIAGGKDTPSGSWGSKFAYSPGERIQDLTNEKCILAIGHRRLSILDLSDAGHQPMSSSDGRYWIAFNGEIYNYLDIKNELRRTGHHFITRTDTEVILAAYAEWGEKCLEKLAGMWAFAIYDTILGEIFLARDRYGIKPLYYWFSPNGSFYFASEIKQFTLCKGWAARMNPERGYDYLAYSFTDHTDETMFAGVFQLPSGSCYRSAIYDLKQDINGRITNYKWYSQLRKPFTGTFSDATEVFRELFEKSVREHLSADVPVGTALSGGLDSSSIVCEVNRILRIDGKSELQKTFSSCAADERYDEKKWMDIVINHTSVDAHLIYPQLQEAIDSTPDLIWYQDEPYQSQSAFLGYSVFGLAKKNGVKVLLNGQGADEYLGGYGQFAAARYANMVRQLRISALLNDINKLRKVRNISKSTLSKHILYHLIPANIRKRALTLTSSADEVKKMIDIGKLNITDNHPYEIIPVKMNSIPEISEHLTFYSTLPKYLRWEDRNSMAHSVEARVPFLDHRLVEFAYSLPEDFLEKDGVTKRVMREAMGNLLPEKIKNRKDKMGFTTPEEMWVKREKPDFFKGKIAEAISVTGGIINNEALSYFDKIVVGEVPFDFTYWRLILFSEWVKKFQVKLL
ncbi:MAG TPA: asparagine synthase (glutamine-hydrolyzing) [Bacteroidales bacterium]|nr:asparagine synthase (glutamine-hydrolyzing) [Bacteroidales bacterium]